MSDLVQSAQELIDRLSKTPTQTENLPEVVKRPPIEFNFGKTFFPVKQFNMTAELLTFIEVYYNKFRKLPGQQDILTQFKDHLEDFPNDPDGWVELLESLVEPLTNRGIPFYDTTNDPDYLDPHFVLAVGLICNPLNKKSRAAKLKQAGLTAAQFNGLSKLPNHRAYLEEQVNSMFNDQTILDAKLGLQEAIANGDLQSIKFYYEIQNLYRPQEQSAQNLLQIIHVLMEILAQNVSAEVLARIQDEFSQTNIIEATLHA
jgi:hypothetical protein